ncbi:hypothetical protein QR680_010131 [Steinernema hermaphroditum]|uniref:Uncharacterized protein n=1 Tax=Steinernema hermaphroditum TaxID=289476 RepID=A0AA39IPI5_9BILA|nr:hypothetical protein QR680_010131 [Steinernema hermaphroditum]
MCVLELKRQEKFMQKATLAAQRTLLRNLMLMTAVPAFLGGTPLAIAIFFIYYHEIPYARQIVAISILVVANHGTVYGILTLCLFSSYRKAVKEFVRWPLLKLNRLLPKNWQMHSQTWAIKVTAVS